MGHEQLVGGVGQRNLTVPMQLMLYSKMMGGPSPYPAGQTRLIMLGLYNRSLARADGSLTANGKWIGRQIARKVRSGEIAAEWVPGPPSDWLSGGGATSDLSSDNP